MRQLQTSPCVQKPQPQVSDLRRQSMERSIDISVSQVINPRGLSVQTAHHFHPKTNTCSVDCQRNLEARRQQHRQAFSVDKMPVSDRLDLRRLRGGTPARANRRHRQGRKGEMHHSCSITPAKLTQEAILRKTTRTQGKSWSGWPQRLSTGQWIITARPMMGRARAGPRKLWLLRL